MKPETAEVGRGKNGNRSRLNMIFVRRETFDRSGKVNSFLCLLVPVILDQGDIPQNHYGSHLKVLKVRNR